jgi:carbamoyl-phosphate synthase large subunit
MKIGIISDIHGNHIALKSVLNAMKKEKVDEILILGDFVGYYYHPDKVFKLLDEWNYDFVKGNHDEMLKIAHSEKKYQQKIIEKYGHGFDIALKTLPSDLIDKLASSPMKKIIEIDNFKILISHSAPWNPELRIYPDSKKKLFEKFKDYNVDFVFMGHTHHPYIKNIGNLKVINVGSVGQLRSQGGLASWAVLDTSDKNVEIRFEKFSVFSIIRDSQTIDPNLPYLWKVLKRMNKATTQKKFENILITGCGGDIACALAKILKREKFGKKIVGCDVSKDNVGKFIFDSVEIIQSSKNKKYVSTLKNIIKKNNINVVIPMSEDEIKFLYENNIQNIINIPVLILSDNVLKIGFDKLKTNHFLKNNGFIFPETEIISNNLPKKYPVIAKNRFGRGSKGLFLVKNDNDAKYIIQNKKDYVWQEYLPDGESEYTCGLYRSYQDGKDIRTIIIRRTLAGGFTSFGEIVRNINIKKMLLSLAKKIDLKGSMNVQLRLKNKEPYIFEINPRFSSTVYFRHVLGFQDLIWSLMELQGEKLPEYYPPKKGVKFYRGIKEYFSGD